MILFSHTVAPPSFVVYNKTKFCKKTTLDFYFFQLKQCSKNKIMQWTVKKDLRV